MSRTIAPPRAAERPPPAPAPPPRFASPAARSRPGATPPRRAGRSSPRPRRRGCARPAPTGSPCGHCNAEPGVALGVSPRFCRPFTRAWDALQHLLPRLPSANPARRYAVVKNMKTRVAAAATIVGLGGLTGLALSAGSQKSASIAAKPLVRTKVIRRTIHAPNTSSRSTRPAPAKPPRRPDRFWCDRWSSAASSPRSSRPPAAPASPAAGRSPARSPPPGTLR